MKKLIYLFLFVSILQSCKLVGLDPESRIDGKWTLTGLTIKDATDKTTDVYKLLLGVKPCFETIVYDFKADGNLVTTPVLGCNLADSDLLFDKSATYVFDKKNISIGSNNVFITAKVKMSVTGKKMILTESVNNEEYTYTFARQ